MIGVKAKAQEISLVEEFFQLFKTPWEFFKEGRTYDVVLVTSEDVPAVDAKLLLIYGSESKNCDGPLKITPRSRLRGASLSYHGTRVPIYRELLTFEGAGVHGLSAASGTPGVKVPSGGFMVMRIGYELFQEVEFLLTVGQPVENASIPVIDIHIMMLRNWILDAGISLLEIPPVPAGHAFTACLTHDIDFAGIRRHKFDHTMWGFLYRSTVGAFRDFIRRRISGGRLLRNWRAAASLPFVYLGWARDFWIQFDRYLQIERNLPATYFLIPFKNRPGDRLTATHAKRRAALYDIADLPKWTAILIEQGCEIGVHGIDAWHSLNKARAELERVAAVTGASEIGIRMHWLLRDESTFRVLEEAGYDYDATVGYNETIGYPSGTTQVYRPLGSRGLLELPLSIQDGALFYPQRLDLSETAAWKVCEALIQNGKAFGGALTILWHDRSLGPERFWGDFYTRLVHKLKSMDVWFGTSAQVVHWFRKRRRVTFEKVEAAGGTARLKVCCNGEAIVPPLILRTHRPRNVGGDHQAPLNKTQPATDIPWTGEIDIELGPWLCTVADAPSQPFALIPELA